MIFPDFLFTSKLNWLPCKLSIISRAGNILRIIRTFVLHSTFELYKLPCYVNSLLQLCKQFIVLK